MRKLALAPILAALLTVATAAHADAEAERTALFKEGVALAEKNDWSGAADRFRKVVAIRSAPKALFTLAQAEEHLGHFVSAKAAYERAKTESGPQDAAVAKAATDALKNVTPHIARIFVAVPADAAGATITIDGATAAAGDPGMEVDPGTHRVHVEVAGRTPFDQDAVAADGARVDVSAQLDAIAAPPPSPVTTPDASKASSPKIVPPIALAAGGVGSLLIGSILFATARSSYTDASSTCHAGACSSDAVNKADGARSRMVVGDVFMIVGAAAAATGGTWLVLKLTKKPKPSDAAAIITPAHGGAFATYSHRF